MVIHFFKGASDISEATNNPFWYMIDYERLSAPYESQTEDVKEAPELIYHIDL